MIEVSSRTQSDRKKVLRSRCYAFYTDLTIIAILQKLVVLTYIRCIKELLTTIPFDVKANLLSKTYQLTFPTLVFTFFSYFLVSYFFNHGTTIGKALFSLRVCSNHDNEELSLVQCLLRSLTYTFCYLGGGLLLAIPFLRKDVKGLPDMMGSSQVLTLDEFNQRAERIHHDNTKQNQLELFVA